MVWTSNKRGELLRLTSRKMAGHHYFYTILHSRNVSYVHIDAVDQSVDKNPNISYAQTKYIQRHLKLPNKSKSNRIRRTQISLFSTHRFNPMLKSQLFCLFIFGQTLSNLYKMLSQVSHQSTNHPKHLHHMINWFYLTGDNYKRNTREFHEYATLRQPRVSIFQPLNV